MPVRPGSSKLNQDLLHHDPPRRSSTVAHFALASTGLLLPLATCTDHLVASLRPPPISLYCNYSSAEPGRLTTVVAKSAAVPRIGLMY